MPSIPYSQLPVLLLVRNRISPERKLKLEQMTNVLRTFMVHTRLRPFFFKLELSYFSLGAFTFIPQLLTSTFYFFPEYVTWISGSSILKKWPRGKSTLWWRIPKELVRSVQSKDGKGATDDGRDRHRGVLFTVSVGNFTLTCNNDEFIQLLFPWFGVETSMFPAKEALLIEF